jgi:hypothetical protein
MQEEKVIKGDRTQEKANIPYEMRRLRGWWIEVGETNGFNIRRKGGLS